MAVWLGSGGQVGRRQGPTGGEIWCADGKFDEVVCGPSLARVSLIRHGPVNS
jgi:hypothetical protein